MHGGGKSCVSGSLWRCPDKKSLFGRTMVSVLQTTDALAVVPRPAERGCRSALLGRGWERPPSPKARYGVAASVFSQLATASGVAPPPEIPLREGRARRHERVGLTGAATSDSEPERPMGTADPTRHGDHGKSVVHPGDSLQSANPVGNADLAGVEGAEPLVSLAGDTRSVAPASMLNSLSG